MASYDTVVYLALMGHPVLEVTTLVRRNQKTIETLHFLINHEQVISDETAYECPPRTDPIGTSFEHGISEHELEQFGVSLTYAHNTLKSFLCDTYTKVPLIVNDYTRYQSLSIARNVTAFWNGDLMTDSPSDTHRLVLGKTCPAHHSSYYRIDRPPLCTLKVAAIMCTWNYVACV